MLAKQSPSDTRNEFTDVLSDAFAEKLDIINKKLCSGSVVDRADFAAAGIRATVIPTAMQKLRRHYGLDVLTISRGKKLVGWVVSSEIL